MSDAIASRRNAAPASARLDAYLDPIAQDDAGGIAASPRSTTLQASLPAKESTLRQDPLAEKPSDENAGFPEESTYSSKRGSGIGEYRDDPGNLVDGVDRMGALNASDELPDDPLAPQSSPLNTVSSVGIGDNGAEEEKNDDDGGGDGGGDDGGDDGDDGGDDDGDDGGDDDDDGGDDGDDGGDDDDDGGDDDDDGGDDDDDGGEIGDGKYALDDVTPLIFSESNLPDGRNPSPEELVKTGTLRVDHETDPVTVVLEAEGETITLSLDASGALVSRSGGPLNLAAGSLDIETVTVSGGRSLITYRYTLERVLVHPEQGADILPDDFSVTVRGPKGSVSETVSVSVVDDFPSALNDVAEMEAGLNITGNILDNDNFGADGPGARGGIRGFGLSGGRLSPVPDDGTLEIEGRFGKLVLEADGSYRYTRTKLMRAEDEDSFVYALSDGDGDITHASLIVRLKDEGREIDQSLLAVYQPTVDEHSLVEGGQTTRAAQSGLGAFVVMANGEMFSLEIVGRGGDAITVEIDAFGGLLGGPYFVNGDAGTLAVTGTYLAAGQVGVLYRYTLNNAIHHAPGVEVDKDGDHFAVTVTAASGKQANGAVSIAIVNDVPVPDADFIVLGGALSVYGNVLNNDNFGADGPAAGGGCVAVAHGALTDAGAVSGFPGEAVSGKFGVLTLMPDGSYVFTRTKLMSAEDEDAFTYVIEDGDGDRAFAHITIAYDPEEQTPVLNTTISAVVADESSLAAGSAPDPTSLVRQGAFYINTRGETCEITLESRDSAATATFAVNPDGSLSGGPYGIPTPTGTLTVTGGSIVRGILVVSYEYRLENRIQHDPEQGPNLKGDGDAFTVTATNSSGLQTSEQLTVAILDDVPHFQSAVAALTVTEGATTAEYAVTLTKGADGTPASTFSVNGETVAAAGTPIIGGLGTLTVNPDGTYAYTANPGVQGRDVFTFSYEDADGDVATEALRVFVLPETEAGRPRVAPYESGLENGTAPQDGGAFQELDLSAMAGWSIVGLTGNDVGVDYGVLEQRNGQWGFLLTKSIEHAPGDGANIDPASPPLPLPTITATNDLETKQVPVEIYVIDDAPIMEINGLGAQDDALFVASGELSAVQNVFLDKGADQVAGDAFTVNGAIVDRNGVAIVGSRGTLTANADGSFRYKANPNAEGGDLFTFQYTDGDGDVVEKTFGAVVEKPDIPPELADGFSALVNEAGLLNGTSPGSGENTGALNLSRLPDGWNVVGVTASDSLVEYGSVALLNGVWSFVLGQAVRHQPGDGANVETVAPLPQPTVTIKDTLGNTWHVPVAVTVVDDVPELLAAPADQYVDQNDPLMQASGTMEKFLFGADGPAAAGEISVTPPDVPLTNWGQTVTYSLDDGSLTAWVGGVGGEKVFDFSIDAKGRYAYAQYRIIDGVEKDLVFGVTATDKDVDALFLEDAVMITISPAPELEPDDRFVYHLYNAPDFINNQEITGSVLANDVGRWTNAIVSTTNGAYGTTAHHADGTVTYALNSDVYQLPYPPPEKDWFLYTARDAAGNLYTRAVEVLIDVAPYTSYVAPGDVVGETHKSVLKDSYGVITFTNGDDLWYGSEVVIGMTAIDFMEGDNVCRLTMDTNGGEMRNSTMTFGSGDDVVSLGATTVHSSSNMAMGDSSISTGSGNDSVTVYHRSLAMMASILETGDGNDEIFIYGHDDSGNATAPAVLLSNNESSGAQSAIYAGSGDDVITFAAGELRSGYVFAEDGDDVVRLNHASPMAGNKGLPTSNMLLGAVLDGGGDNGFNARQGKVGDLISLDADLSAVQSGKELAGMTGAAVKNFESLHLDFRNNAVDNLNLNPFLSNLSQKGFTGADAFKALIVTGENTDQIAKGGTSVQLTDAGISLNNEYFSGMTFDAYTVSSGNMSLNMLLQSGITVV